jgi:hypothetical protein
MQTPQIQQIITVGDADEHAPSGQLNGQTRLACIAEFVEAAEEVGRAERSWERLHIIGLCASVILGNRGEEIVNLEVSPCLLL